jgi:hypothetical protein
MASRKAPGAAPESGLAKCFQQSGYRLANSLGPKFLENVKRPLPDVQERPSVESLKGSGPISGETLGAYIDIFTITLVTLRSVGIGAYLVRLGARRLGR